MSYCLYPQVTEPLELVGMDLVGKVTLTGGDNQFICVMVDYFTKLADSYPVKWLVAWKSTM